MIEKHSPLALPLALHIHDVFNHKGNQSTYRHSLGLVRLLGGKQLFRSVGLDCVICLKNRKHLLKQVIGPLSDYQLLVSPVFYYCLTDMWGPLTIYCPGYKKATRSSAARTYNSYFLIFCCVVTGMTNVQLIERKDTAAVLDGCSRFINEAGVPKIMLPDDDVALT